MILAGDELGHSQNGNNNAYCQDNETSWIDWRDFARDEAFLRFVQRVIDLRKRGHPDVSPHIVLLRTDGRRGTQRTLSGSTLADVK